MFPNGYVVWQVRREYNRDRLREAERYRLMKQACLARRRQDRFYCRALTWLGRRLVDWGSHLQERYAALADPGLLGAANQGQ
jgi:hypothetical protein